MKLATFLLLAFSVCAFSQNIEMSEEKVISMLCKTWKIDHNKKGGEYESTYPTLKHELTITYKSDYTFTVNLNGSKTLGEWCYDKNQKAIILHLRGESSTQIGSLTKDHYKMILSNQARRKNVLETDYAQYVVVN